MSHEYFLWMSYGAAAVAIVVELALLAAGRKRARRAIDEERELETQD
jgi:heme exporter protein CcmD